MTNLDDDDTLKCVAEMVDMVSRSMSRGTLPLRTAQNVICRLRCTLAVLQLRRRARCPSLQGSR